MSGTRPNSLVAAALPLVATSADGLASSGVLCPELHRLLGTRLNSPVRVVSPGEAFAASWPIDPGTGLCRPSIASPGEYYRVNCPYCSDARQRLWVNYMYGQVDPTGRRLTYLAHCYNEDCLSRPGMRREFEDLILGFRNVRDRNPTPMHVYEGTVEPAGLFEAAPPGHVHSLTQLFEHQPAHKAVQYMVHERRYTLGMLTKYHVGYCYGADARYQTAQDRIVFPIYFNGIYVGWQTRFIGDINWSAHNTPKYFTLPGFHKRLALYNYDCAKHKDFVVVTEGVTDVHSCGDHSVALFGKTLSQHQRHLLLTIGDRKPIIFLLDADAQEEMEGMISTIAEAPGQHPVVAVQLPEGSDPGDYERTALWNIITTEAARRGVPLRFTG